MSISIRVVGPDPVRLSRITSALPADQERISIRSMTGGVLEAASEVQRDPPDLLVLESPALAEADLALLESSLLSAPGTATVLLSDNRSSEFLIRAMRAGVREVVPSPPGAGELSAAFARHLERLGLQRLGAAPGQVLALMPAKGGSGATFIGCNLAAELASRGERTLLIDLNAPFGDAALHLVAQRPAADLADLARQVDRLDTTLLDSIAVHAAEDLYLLAAPESVEAFAEVRAEALDRIIALARSRFRFIVVDAGRALDPVTVRALDRADRIVLVAQPSLPYLHAARRVRALFDGLGYSSDTVRLLLNRVERGDDPSPEAAARMLETSIDEQIPNSYRAVSRAINQGEPIRVSAPRDPVTRALAAFAERLLANSRPAGPPAKGDFSPKPGRT